MMALLGNKYSCRHERFNRDQTQFWDFSLDELVRLDLPSLVAGVRRDSGFDKVILIGFSQGAAVMSMALASQPDLRKVMGSHLLHITTSIP